MIWAFVDYENVGSLASLDLSQYERLIVFCGPRHRKLNLGEIPTNSFSHLDIIRMESTGKNNLDFHLAFYMGVRDQSAGKDIEFHVISNDTGFNGLIQHMVDIGRPCRRISTSKKKTAKQASKKVVAKKAAKKSTPKKVAKKGHDPIGELPIVTAKAAADKIKSIEPRSRPSTRNKLLNWLSELTLDKKAAELLYKRMIKYDFIDVDGTKITYLV